MELTPVASSVCYEMMKLCTGSVQHINGWNLVVLTPILHRLTDRQTLKDKATQLVGSRSGALVTQSKGRQHRTIWILKGIVDGTVENDIDIDGFFCRIPPIQYFSAPPAAVRAVQGTPKLWRQWRLVPKRAEKISDFHLRSS